MLFFVEPKNSLLFCSVNVYCTLTNNIISEKCILTAWEGNKEGNVNQNN